MIAMAVKDQILVNVEIPGLCLTADLPDGFESYKTLPNVISYEGRTYGRTGWNSDRNVCYYRSDATTAMVIK